jgi:glycerol uptake facilitator-like aquaporin
VLATRTSGGAAGAYIMAWGTMSGPFEGASMNPARSFGPDDAIGKADTVLTVLLPVITDNH